MIRLRDDVVWREVSGEVVLLDMDTNRYLTVNPTGAALWPRIVAGTSAEALEEDLVARFGIDAAHARRDVDAFVAWLAEQRLLVDAQR